MYAARPKSPLRNFEATAFAQQHVIRRNANVLVLDLEMAARRVVVAERGEWPHQSHAGSILRHQDHRLLLVARRGWVGLAHHDQQPATLVACTGRPPFATVEHVIVTIADDRQPDVRRIGRGDPGLGHREARADLARKQRPEPPLLLRLGSVPLQYFHVTRVGRGAVEDLGRDRRTPHNLAQRRIFEIVQPGPGRAFGQKQVPQSLGARSVLQLVHDWRTVPAAWARGMLRSIDRFGGIDVARHEARQLLLKRQAAFAEFHHVGQASLWSSTSLQIVNYKSTV